MKMAGALSERSIVFKDRPHLRGLLRGIFEAKSAENGFGAVSRAVLGDGHTSTLANQIFIVAHGRLEVCLPWVYHPRKAHENEGEWRQNSVGGSGEIAITVEPLRL
jgi:hypothetical protein